MKFSRIKNRVMKKNFAGLAVGIGILSAGLLAVTVSGTFTTFTSSTTIKASEVNMHYLKLSYKHFLISVSSVSKTSEQILFRKVWKVMQNFFVGHSRSHVFENIVNGDSHSADTRFATAHFGIKGNEFSIINRFHVKNVNLLKRKSSENYTKRTGLFRSYK